MTNFQRSVSNLIVRASFVFVKLIVVYPGKLPTLYGIRSFVTESFEVIMEISVKISLTECDTV
jgi:hypothetical protein